MLCYNLTDVPSAVKDGDNSKVTEAQLDAVRLRNETDYIKLSCE